MNKWSYPFMGWVSKTCMEMMLDSRLVSVVLLEIFEKEVVAFRVLLKIFDNDTGSAYHLRGVPFVIDLAKPRPFSQLLSIRDAHEVDPIVSAKGFNQLCIVWLFAVLCEYAQFSLSQFPMPRKKQRETPVT